MDCDMIHIGSTRVQKLFAQRYNRRVASMPSAKDLKTMLKGFGMSQAGDKGTLEARIALFNTCKSMQLVSAEGINPLVL